MNPMNNQTANILRRINNEFYAKNAASFASTRNNSWRGWQQAMEAIQAKDSSFFTGGEELRVLDVACGNLRFETWLSDRYPDCSFDFAAVDNCQGLLPVFDGEEPSATTRFGAAGNGAVVFQDLDVLDQLLSGGFRQVEDAIEGEDFDLVCSFGFMHHVPDSHNRIKLVHALASKVRPGGFLVLSLWQFMNSEELAARARESHAAGLERFAAEGLSPTQLEPGDYLLGWNGDADAFRYCHHFNDVETAWLTMGVGEIARPVASFSCDGRTGNLNGYLVLQRF